MRYHPLTDDDRALMLQRIGVASVDDLFTDVPADKLWTERMDLPAGRSEIAVERALSAMARRNHAAGDGPFFLGAGAYRHHVPASVDHLIQRSEFLTSYTPYQAEISQGTLQVLFEFQTQVARLTGMEVANASMYDGSTAAAEAVMMAARVTRRGRALVAGGVHPQYRDVIATIATGVEVEAMPGDPTASEDMLARIDEGVACIVVQTPTFYGHLVDLRPLAQAAHAAGAMLVAVFTEAVAFGAIEPPGPHGADIVVGEGQSIGNALSFGGPYVGLFATLKKHVRQMPGRLAGETVDAGGRRGFALTLEHARAAHPPRQGDVQHLHQLGAVRARLLHPHDAARRGGPHPPRPAQPRPRLCHRRRARPRAGRRRAQRDVLQRVHRAPAQRRHADG